MDDSEHKTVPTASEDMFKKSVGSEVPARGGKSNLKAGGRHRFRSKSECPQNRPTGGDESGKPQGSHIGVVVKANDKNDRKPKNLKGNGKPKKAGGGGKGTWGKLGEVYDEEAIDPDDPNYDPDLVKTDILLLGITSELTSVEFDKIVTPIFQDYYNHGITQEVVASLMELNITHLKHRVVYLAITLALEKKGAQRELTSTLLSALYGEKVVTEQDFELGFQALMNALPDSKLDTPDAPVVVGQFMARSVADDCLRPCYIKEHMEHPSADAKVALERAHQLLQMKHGIVRLDSIWGYGGGIRPVKLLVKEIVLMIKEYLSSNDLKEAERCIVDLDVPHFHHEIVYEALMIALDDGSEKTLTNIVCLLKHLYGDTMITVDQMNAGFERIYASMDDVVLDSPRAFKYLDTILEMCCRADIIPLWLRQKAPSRGRKRYVSEGDFSMSNKSLMPHDSVVANGDIIKNGIEESMEE